MLYTKEEKEIIESKAFELSIELWDRFWNLFNIDVTYEVNSRVERNFFLSVKDEFIERLVKQEAPSPNEIVRLAFESFMDDFKQMVETTKDAIGQYCYDNIIYDPEVDE